MASKPPAASEVPTVAHALLLAADWQCGWMHQVDENKVYSRYRVYWHYNDCWSQVPIEQAWEIYLREHTEPG